MNRLTTYLIWLFSLLVGLAPYATSGQPKARVSNVRVELDAVRAKILYDLADNLPSDSIFIQVENSSKQRLDARTVTGDAGKGITSGTNKTIYWDYRLDGVTLTEKDPIRVKVLIGGVRTGGGPINALASVLLPGVGNILVQPNRRVGLRPLITVGYAGLLTYGLFQRSRSRQQYNLYMDLPSTDESELLFEEANRLHHHYYIATRAAAAVLVADVVYTYLKGRRNQQQRNPPRVVLNYLDRAPTVGVQLTF